MAEPNKVCYGDVDYQEPRAEFMQPQDSSSSASTSFESAGRALGRAARSVKQAANQGDWVGKAEKVSKATGEKYTRVTGRDSAHDGKVLGICAAAGGAVLATGAALQAASTVVAGATLAAAGTVGAAVYCKRNGHDKELDTIQRGASSVGRGVYTGVSSFSRGVRQGYDKPRQGGAGADAGADAGAGAGASVSSGSQKQA